MKRQIQPDGNSRVRAPFAREDGAVLILMLVFIVFATLLGMALLFILDVEFKTSRSYLDSIEALNDADSAVQEVLWRLNLESGSRSKR